MSNTPIHKWFLPGIPEGFEVSVKRDDMTGSVLSGNKIRKLEFLLADAKSQGCDTVITSGRRRSNHCRTTAIAAKQMGMDCHLVLRTDNTKFLKGSFVGNTLLDWMVGCNFYVMPLETSYEDANPRTQQLADYLRTSCGRKPYCIPNGGSNVIGLFGYIECFEELLQQGLHERFTDIVITTGSSGSLAGIAVANYLTGRKLKIMGMSVSWDINAVHHAINEELRELGLRGGQGSILAERSDHEAEVIMSESCQESNEVRSEDLCEIIDARGLGYGFLQPHEIECMETVTRATGIVLDPIYNGKSVFHLMRLMRDDPGRFQGKKILYIHTGGVYNVFDHLMESRADSRSPAENKVCDWSELTHTPPFAQ